MVNYLPSQATTSINVTTLDVATDLTIIAPASIVQGQPFLIEGVLRRTDTNVALVGENISLTYNGVNLGTSMTREIEGSIKYQAQVQIDEVGSFTLTASFAGSTRPGLVLLPAIVKVLRKIPGLDGITRYLGVFAIGLTMIGASLLSKRR